MLINISFSGLRREYCHAMKLINIKIWTGFGETSCSTTL